MENRESRTELFEQKAQQRSQELGDQQRIDQKARALSMEQDRNRASGISGPEVNRIEPQLFRVTHTDHVPDGDEVQRIRETNAHKHLWIEQNRTAPQWQIDKELKDIAYGEAQLQKTPLRE